MGLWFTEMLASQSQTCVVVSDKTVETSLIQDDNSWNPVRKVSSSVSCKENLSMSIASSLRIHSIHVGVCVYRMNRKMLNIWCVKYMFALQEPLRMMAKIFTLIQWNLLGWSARSVRNELPTFRIQPLPTSIQMKIIGNKRKRKEKAKLCFTAATFN